MQQKKSPSPLVQQVKGVLILHEGEAISLQAHKLVESFNCKVLTSSNARMMIKGTLGNLQSIKQCWLANDEKSTLSQELNQCVTQIIIGGRA